MSEHALSGRGRHTYMSVIGNSEDRVYGQGVDQIGHQRLTVDGQGVDHYMV